jgi:hypothetical protein
MADTLLLQKALPEDRITAEMIERGTFPKRVTQEAFEEVVAQFFADGDGLFAVETPREEMEQIEAMLESPGVFKGSRYVVKSSCKCCPGCGRENTFLDVVATGLQVHTKEFLVAVFTGQHGHIVNSVPHQRCMCFGCKQWLPSGASKYSAPKVDASVVSDATTTTPAYTYRFNWLLPQ